MADSFSSMMILISRELNISIAYFPLGDFIRATRSENKNPAT